MIAEADLARIKAAVRQQTWAQEAYAALLEQVRAWLDQPLGWPPGWGGHYHWYFCPVHGVPLAFDPQQPLVHRCPVDGQVYQSEAIQAAWEDAKRQFCAGMAANVALLLLMGEQLPGAENRLREVFQHALESTDLILRQTGIGLAEATWLIPLMLAYDWSCGALGCPLTGLKGVEAGLVTGVGEWLRERPGSPNMDAWYAAGVGMAGALLRREDFVSWSVAKFDRVLGDWVLPDGGWIERSPGYATYALWALYLHAESLRGIGLDLYRRQVNARSIKGLVDWLCQLAPPNGQLPAVNDFWYDGFLGPRELELAFARYGDERYLPWIRRWRQGAVRRQAGNDSVSSDGESRPWRSQPGGQWFQPWALLPWQLLFAVPLPEDEDTRAAGGNVGSTPASVGAAARQDEFVLTVLPYSGLAVIRAPSTNLWGLFDYTPGGGHSHPSMFNLSLSVENWPISMDSGTAGYHLQVVKEWYQQSWAHNVVVVDGVSQSRSRRAVLDVCVQDPLGIALSGISDTVYPGLIWRRTVLTLPRLVVVLDRLRSDVGPRTFDWVWHVCGHLQPSAHIGESVIDTVGPTLPGTGFCEQARPVAGDEKGWWLSWWGGENRQLGDDLSSSKRGLVCTLSGPSQPRSVYVASSPGHADMPYLHRNTVIVRQQGNEAVFVHAFILDGLAEEAVALRCLTGRAGQPVEVAIQYGARSWYVWDDLPLLPLPNLDGTAQEGCRGARETAGVEGAGTQWLSTNGRLAWVELAGEGPKGVVIDGDALMVRGQVVSRLHRRVTTTLPEVWRGAP